MPTGRSVAHLPAGVTAHVGRLAAFHVAGTLLAFLGTVPMPLEGQHVSGIGPGLSKEWETLAAGDSAYFSQALLVETGSPVKRRNKGPSVLVGELKEGGCLDVASISTVRLQLLYK